MIIGRSAGVLSQLRFLVSVHKIAGKNRLAPQLRGGGSHWGPIFV